MSSRRFYITLNDKKDKDRIISDYLSQSYSEADAIKEAIYRLATNNIQQVKTGINSNEKVRIVSKGNKEVQKGANNTNKDEKVINDNNSVRVTPISENKGLNETNSNNKVQAGSHDGITLDLGQFSDEPIEVKTDNKNKSEELKQKKLKALKQFM